MRTDASTRFALLTDGAAEQAWTRVAGGSFQHAAWVHAVAAARGRPHAPVLVQARLGDGRRAWLPAGVHRRAGLAVFEAMPMGGYGGWIAEGVLQAAEEEALTRRWLAQASWPLVVLTGVPGQAPTLPAPRPWRRGPRQWADHLRPRAFVTHRLDLSGDDAALLQRARPRLRSYLRQFDRLGFTFSVDRDRASLADCHRWYQAGSRHWQTAAAGLLPEAFFTALADTPAAEVWRVRFEGRPVGAALFLRGARELQYQASGTERIDAPLSAMEALLWAAARHHRDRGCAVLNLGASDGLESVARFKQKFGAEPAAYLRVSYLLPRWRGCAPGLATAAEEGTA